MNFFERQEEARRSTRKLVGLFALAVVLIVLAVYLAVALVAHLGRGRRAGRGLEPDVVRRPWPPSPSPSSSWAASTRSRPSAAAAPPWAGCSAGGRCAPNTRDLKERRLLNVVEEMALASGMPVPSVFVLDKEPGINAFAAGHGSGDTVIGVTRGCLDLLSRDELQGVIGHEFSHVLNGDMRLNLRLMGLLHGILVIAHDRVLDPAEPVGQAA